MCFFKDSYFLLNFYIILLCLPLFQATTILKPRGVSLERKIFYNPAKNFHCIDGTSIIPFDFINDDYCDCDDGSDEPGTAACSNGLFFCIDAAYQSKEIPSSRVNDGICDCCDGSDEYNSTANCLNNCKELGMQAKIDLKAQHEMQAKGHQEKVECIKNAKTIKAELKKELENLRQSQNKAKSLLENIKETSHSRLVLGDEAAAEQFFHDLDEDNDGSLTLAEIQQFTLFDYDNDGEVSRDEAKFYLQLKDSVTQEEFVTTGWAIMRPLYMKHYGDMLKDDSPEVLEIRREESSQLNKKLQELEKQINEKSNSLVFDYGKDDEFRVLKDECFELIHLDYTYKVCFFGKITQKSTQGKSEVLVGEWSNWSGSEENKYNQMRYLNGASCWPGNQRDALVSLSCGLTNALISVTEPSRCHYQFQITTPNICQPSPSESHYLHQEL